MRRIILLCILFILVGAFVVFHQSEAQTRTYKFTLARVDVRSLDDVEDGVEISVTCTRSDLGTGRNNIAKLSWYAEKSVFSTWRPTKTEFKAYLEAYLQTKIKGKKRAKWLMEKADVPVISHESIPALLGLEVNVTI